MSLKSDQLEILLGVIYGITHLFCVLGQNLKLAHVVGDVSFVFFLILNFRK